MALNSLLAPVASLICWVSLPNADFSISRVVALLTLKSIASFSFLSYSFCASVRYLVINSERFLFSAQSPSSFIFSLNIFIVFLSINSGLSPRASCCIFNRASSLASCFSCSFISAFRTFCLSAAS